MNKAEKFFLILFLDAIITYWAAQAELDSGIILDTAWWIVAMIAALLFVVWPKEG